MTQTVLILGATGRFGRHSAAQFKSAGWNVKTFDRSKDDLLNAAQGVDVIVNGWHPPYPDWAVQVPKLRDQVIDAAQRTGATVMIAGNVYVFGAGTPAPWSERSDHAAKNQLGRIRVDMEAAYRASGVKTVILRSGDFLDTEASGNWFDMIMTKTLSKGVFTYPGKPDIPHAWGYLPDLTRALVQLAEKRTDLPVFSDIPFPGYTLTGQDMCSALAAVTGRDVRLKKMNWLPIRLASPFWPLGRYVCEMRYLWDTPHWLDNTLFDQVLPGFDQTPLHRALASAVPASLVQTQIHPDQAVAAGL